MVPWADQPKVSPSSTSDPGPQLATIPLEREEKREFSKPDARPFLYDRDLAPSPSSGVYLAATFSAVVPWIAYLKL